MPDLLQVNSLSPDIFLLPIAEQLAPAFTAAFAGSPVIKSVAPRARTSNFFMLISVVTRVNYEQLVPPVGLEPTLKESGFLKSTDWPD